MFAKEREKTKSPQGRPLAPRLAAARSLVGSPPVTPRLNNAAPASSPSSSPVGSRGLSVAKAPAAPRSGAGVTDRFATPVNATLSDNITPRSSARKSKVSSTSSTPRVTGTNFERNVNSTSHPTDSRTSDLGQSFFHASDAPPQSPPKRPALQPQNSSFIYANGLRDESKISLKEEYDIQSAVSGGSNENPPRVATWLDKQKDTTASGIAAGESSRSASIVSAPVGIRVLNPNATRAQSPTKPPFHLSYRKGASQIIRPEDSRQTFQTLSNQQGFDSSPDLRHRQTSLDTISEPENRMRISSIDSVTDLPFIASNQASPTSPSLSDSPKILNPTYSAGSTAFADSGVPPLRTTKLSSPSLPGLPLVSPVEEEPGRPVNDQQSTAAKARQERKVLDLEISNSSLLAINRSLEREIRKQKAELRRFRRLSRNPNRSSLLSDVASSLDPDVPNYDEDRSDDEDGNFSDGDNPAAHDTMNEDSESEGGMSPEALAENDARHFDRDEERLRLDLSKHKQLIIDSQKMNSSLRRCLGITEQLIKDGGRALEYQVSVSDIKLGGRVLSPEELEMEPDWQEEADSYFGGNWSKQSDELNSSADLQLVAKSDLGTDRDSGVDLEQRIENTTVA